MPRRVTSATEKKRLNAARQRAFRLRRVQSIEQSQLDAQLNNFRPRSTSPPSSPSSKSSSIAPSPNVSPIKPHSPIPVLEKHPFFNHVKLISVSSPGSSCNHAPVPSQDKTYFSGLSTFLRQVSDIDDDMNINNDQVSDSHNTADTHASELTESLG